MNPDRELERAVRDWLVEGWDRLPGQYLDAALDEISTTRQRRLAWPAWRFLEMNTTQRRIVLIAAAATVLVALVGATVFLVGRRPGPGPTGQIAFVSGRDGGNSSHIYVMRADGTDQRLLSDATDWEAWPAISPDGTKVAFTSKRTSIGDTEVDELFVMDIDGSHQTQLTRDGGFAWLPSWSANGRRIVFECTRDGVQQVCVIDADGTNEAVLTTDPVGARGPSLSPDGTKILFLKSDHLNGPIYVMNIDGSNQRQLTSGPSDAGLAWSPDGSMIAFARGPADDRTQIYVMSSDGTGVTQLTNGATTTTYFNGAAWSPDGQSLAIAGGKQGADGDIYVIRVDGTGLVNVSNHPGNNWGPSWR